MDSYTDLKSLNDDTNPFLCCTSVGLSASPLEKIRGNGTFGSCIFFVGDGPTEHWAGFRVIHLFLRSL